MLNSHYISVDKKLPVTIIITTQHCISVLQEQCFLLGVTYGFMGKGNFFSQILNHIT